MINRTKGLLQDLTRWSTTLLIVHISSFAVAFGRPREMKHEDPFQLRVIFKALYEGYHGALMVLKFREIQKRGKYEDFAIQRRLRCLVSSHKDHEGLKPYAPYEVSAVLASPPTNIHPGRVPVDGQKIQWAAPLQHFPVPKELVDVAFGPGKYIEVKNKVKTEFMREGYPFRLGAYKQFFQVLLHLEEAQLRFAVKPLFF